MWGNVMEEPIIHRQSGETLELGLLGSLPNDFDCLSTQQGLAAQRHKHQCNWRLIVIVQSRMEIADIVCALDDGWTPAVDQGSDIGRLAVTQTPRERRALHHYQAVAESRWYLGQKVLTAADIKLDQHNGSDGSIDAIQYESG